MPICYDECNKFKKFYRGDLIKEKIIKTELNVRDNLVNVIE